KIELATIAAPRIAPDLDEVAPVERAHAGPAPAESAASVASGADAAETPRPARGQGNRFALLAASLALAAAFGGMVGAIGATSLLRPATP
ncbi:hypothetical protein NL533_31935, partial [Klebsiella pneumoniae]|nr:hypothetical protein [Klebsiella pneumoniae]